MNDQYPNNAMTTPIPDEGDDDLVCEGLHCLDQDACLFATEHDLVWRCEVPVLEKDIQSWKSEDDPTEMAFVVSAA